MQFLPAGIGQLTFAIRDENHIGLFKALSVHQSECFTDGAFKVGAAAGEGFRSSQFILQCVFARTEYVHLTTAASSKMDQRKAPSALGCNLQQGHGYRLAPSRSFAFGGTGLIQTADNVAQETGGSIGLRDEALLDSALENAFAGFDGQEFYPTKEEKGARLGYTLISNHAFVDGNKRIGMYVMLTFLEVNGIHMECTNEEVVEVGLSVASGTMGYDALLQWVRDHRI